MSNPDPVTQGPRLFTSDGYKAILHRHGFSSSEDGAKEYLNKCLYETLGDITAQGVMQADYEKKVGLNGHHAAFAINNTPEIPKGMY